MTSNKQFTAEQQQTYPTETTPRPSVFTIGEWTAVSRMSEFVIFGSSQAGHALGMHAFKRFANLQYYATFRQGWKTPRLFEKSF